MSRSLEMSRPLRAGRHRAEAASSVTEPLTPTSLPADVPPAGTASMEPVSPTVPAAPVPTMPATTALRRRRDRRPAFEVPPAPETAPISVAAPVTVPESPAPETTPIAEVPPAPVPESSAPETAPIAEVPPAPPLTRRRRTRREAVDKPADTTPPASSSSEPRNTHSPQVAAMFSSQPDDALRKAGSARVMGQRMAIVAGAFVVLLGVGAASQATDLPFFGKESSAQEAAGPTKVTRATSGTRPTAGTAAPQPTNSATSPGTTSGSPAQAAAGAGAPAAVSPQANGLPGIGGLPVPLDAPTLAGIAAATTAAAPPSAATSLSAQPPASSSSPPAPSPTAAPAPATTAPAPAPAPTQSPTTPLKPITGLVAPLLDTATGTESASADGADDTTTYASTRLSLYGLTAGK